LSYAEALCTTKKGRAFQTAYLGGPVTDLPGVGDALGGKLRKKGLATTAQLVGQFLLMDGDPVAFQAHLLKLLSPRRSHAAKLEELTQTLSQHVVAYLVTHRVLRESVEV